MIEETRPMEDSPEAQRDSAERKRESKKNDSNARLCIKNRKNSICEGENA